jgi:hypothetical protein
MLFFLLFQVHDQLMTEISLLQISLVSGAWQLSKNVVVPEGWLQFHGWLLIKTLPVQLLVCINLNWFIPLCWIDKKRLIKYVGTALLKMVNNIICFTADYTIIRPQVDFSLVHVSLQSTSRTPCFQYTNYRHILSTTTRLKGPQHYHTAIWQFLHSLYNVEKNILCFLLLHFIKRVDGHHRL